MKPTIGLIVHYYDEMLKPFAPRGTGPYAAIVTFVHSDAVIDVEIFPVRMFGEEVLCVEFMGGDRGQTRWWCWPPREREEPIVSFTSRQADNVRLVDQIKGMPAQPGTSETDADPRNPNVPSNENVV